ncbi:MAG: FAD-dependent oxidoreductase [Alphaproteobacteria bacterium]|nr:FAD-dependent oxidoreductase [Alphaproteobacteria bacterium]
MITAERNTGRAHVIGAGLAGLAASVELAARGYPVVLYESSQQAGGRCRSYFDSELGCRIDNGNHLLLSGNVSALAYVDLIGARDTFQPPGAAAIPFVDLADNARWTVRPAAGRIPWWLFAADRRVPGARLRDYLRALKLWRATPEDTVAGLLDARDVLYRRLWEPLAVAALNTAAADGAARLLARIVAETLGRGAAACRPMLPRDGLSESFVDPALRFLRQHGGDIRFGARLRSLDFADRRLTSLDFDGDRVTVHPDDTVILAVPASIAGRLVPGLMVPDDYAPIVNAHYRYDLPADAPRLTGIVGGTAEWVFAKPGIASVTVSAADAIVDQPAAELRDALWPDVAMVLSLPPLPVPLARIVKERRATFRATSAQEARRPVAATQWNNLHLAGDYTATGLPATIEGAIRSGVAAAFHVHQGRTPQAASSTATVTRSTAHFRDCLRTLS